MRHPLVGGLGARPADRRFGSILGRASAAPPAREAADHLAEQPEAVVRFAGFSTAASVSRLLGSGQVGQSGATYQRGAFSEM